MKKLIKAIAFEKAVIEVLKKDNPQLKENFSAYEKFDRKTNFLNGKSKRLTTRAYDR